MTLAAKIRKFRNSLPARSTARCIFSLGQEFLCFLGGLGFLLVDFTIIGFVEGINVFAGCCDRFLFLLNGGFVAAG